MDGDQEITREFNFYTVNESDDDTIYKLPNMLDEMVLLDNRYQIYMDGKIPPVSDAQLRNPVSRTLLSRRQRWLKSTTSPSSSTSKTSLCTMHWVKMLGGVVWCHDLGRRAVPR